MAQGYSVRDLLWNRIQIYYSTDLQCIVQWHRSTIAQCYYGTMLLDLPGRDLLSQRTTMAEIYYGTLLLWHRAPAQILISLPSYTTVILIFLNIPLGLLEYILIFWLRTMSPGPLLIFKTTYSYRFENDFHFPFSILILYFQEPQICLSIKWSLGGAQSSAETGNG